MAWRADCTAAISKGDMDDEKNMGQQDADRTPFAAGSIDFRNIYSVPYSKIINYELF